MRLIDADKLYKKFGAYTEKASMECAKARNENERKVWDCIKEERSNAMRLIRSEPTVNQWIPCVERLPDELTEVNITWINTNPAPYYEFTKGKPSTGSAVYYKGRWYWYSAVCTDYLAEYGFSPNDDMDDAIEVIAWQPLPKPYFDNYGFASEEEADAWLNSKPVGKEEI